MRILHYGFERYSQCNNRAKRQCQHTQGFQRDMMRRKDDKAENLSDKVAGVEQIMG
ncbi:MAG: hypothetical protein PHI11_14580 [Gallionella sp.]|nr:hypothetical protein [Gallionella sp.]